jgi:hypothetical protein
MSGLPDLRARLRPQDLDVLDGASGKQTWSAVVSMATRCQRLGFDFEEYTDLLYPSEIGLHMQSGNQADNDRPTANRGRFDTKLRKAWDWAEENFRHGGKGWLEPEIVAGLEQLRSSTDNQHLAAIITIALDTGHHPVSASARQVHAIVGGRLQTTGAQLRRLADSAGPHSEVLEWADPPGYRMARVWTLNLGMEVIGGDICVPPPRTSNDLGKQTDGFNPGCTTQDLSEAFTVPEYAAHLGVPERSARDKLKAMERAGEAHKSSIGRYNGKVRERDLWSFGPYPTTSVPEKRGVQMGEDWYEWVREHDARLRDRQPVPFVPYGPDDPFKGAPLDDPWVKDEPLVDRPNVDVDPGPEPEWPAA